VEQVPKIMAAQLYEHLGMSLIAYE